MSQVTSDVVTRLDMVNAMMPGRDMDVRIAEQVEGLVIEWLGTDVDRECSGWLICPDCEHGVDPGIQAQYGIAPHTNHEQMQPCYRNEPGGPAFVVPEYSSYMGVCWPLAVKYRVSVLPWQDTTEWVAMVHPRSRPAHVTLPAASALGPDAPTAICRAILHAHETGRLT